MMKYKWITALLALTLCITAAGCAEQAASSAPTEHPTAQSFGEAFDAAVPEAAVPETSTVPAEEQASAPETAPIEEAEIPVEVEVDDEAAEQTLSNMIAAAALCSVVDQMSYMPDDPIYFWRAIGYFVALSAEDHREITIEDGFAVISAADLAPYVSAMFPNYSGEYPSVTEEDPLISTDGADTYYVNLYPVEGVYAELDRVQIYRGDQYCVDAVLSDGSTWFAILNDYDGPVNGAFRYSLAEIS